MAEFHLPPPPAFLPVPGEPPIPWREWYADFENYLIATDLDSAAHPRRKAILLHCLGTEGQRITRTLTITPTLTFPEFATKLKEHFEPKQSITMERKHFRDREQHVGESIRQYVAALRGLASKCQFGDLQDAMIRDQLTDKARSSRIRERLILEPDSSTLQKLVDLACHRGRYEGKQSNGRSKGHTDRHIACARREQWPSERR